MAREIDIKAAEYLHEEQLKREVEREQRDREFWIVMFGGQSKSDGINPEEMPEAIPREQWQAT